MRKRLVFLAPLAILAFLVFVTIGVGMVMLLWNWLLPRLFGWPEISFWQALGILALCRILFGGLGLHRSGSSRWRQRFAERCARMTPEERERFRQAMRARWGFGPSTAESKEP